MNAPRTIALGLACAVALGACATKTPPPPKVTTSSTSTERGGGRDTTVTITETVEAVDLATRTVTLRRADGSTVDIRVGEQVRNLPQVRRGDRVVVTYYESIAFEVLKPGQAKPSISSDDDVAVAPLGSRPKTVTSRETTLVATIVSLDRANQRAVIRGPDRKTMEVKVQNPEHFDKVRVGDTVEITTTEALAIDVKPAR